MNDISKDIEIAILHQISRAVLQERDVSALLKKVLDVLHREIGFERGTFTLLRDGVLIIEASHGLTEEEIKRGKYRLGEGITGRVAQIASPILIPEISTNPNFLNRTQTRSQLKNVAFLCVPILHLEQVIGTLSMDRQITETTNLTRDMKLLETVANITADAVAACLEEYEERETLLAENARLREELDSRSQPSQFIGTNSRMQAVYAMIGQVAGTDATVLIRGASGTGKELVARAILEKSSRRQKPFLILNCSALGGRMEAELFGLEEHPGKLDQAEGGTIYLEEIGDLPMSAQVRLLHFLQDHTYSRINDGEVRHADVRIIAATAHDLEKRMEDGQFREDLYYRLSVFPIHLPELRNRRSDIILLAEYFLEKYCRQYGKNIKRISTPAVNMMMSYHWPGNVRELENCIERAVLSSNEDVIAGYHLPPSLQTGKEADLSRVPAEGRADFTTLVESFERELIVEALKANQGNVSASARALNLTNRVIHYKIDKLNITPEWYKINAE